MTINLVYCQEDIELFGTPINHSIDVRSFKVVGRSHGIVTRFFDQRWSIFYRLCIDSKASLPYSFAGLGIRKLEDLSIHVLRIFRNEMTNYSLDAIEKSL